MATTPMYSSQREPMRVSSASRASAREAPTGGGDIATGTDGGVAPDRTGSDPADPNPVRSRMRVESDQIWRLDLKAGRQIIWVDRPGTGLVVIGLDRPGIDYQGGEFLTLEQRARAQSRGTTSAIPQGEGLVFTTRDRPVPSKRGWSLAPMRHGVSVLRSGLRRTLGLVFHDAQ